MKLTLPNEQYVPASMPAASESSLKSLEGVALEQLRTRINTEVDHLPELVKQTSEAMRAIPPEQWFMISEKWTKVLTMLDSLDEKTGDTLHPHFTQIRYLSYHFPQQSMSYPGTEKAKEQFAESARWITRLAKDINVDDLLNLPEDKDAARTFDGSYKFCEKNDPGFDKTAEDVSALLERLVDPNSDRTLDFALTEENYQKLDSPQKKLIAFLLLKSRVSQFVGGMVGEMTLVNKYDKPITDIRQVYEYAKAQSEPFRAEWVDEYLNSSMDAKTGKTVLEWVSEQYQNPLTTDTSEVYMHGKNSVREQFVARVKAVVQPLQTIRNGIDRVLEAQNLEAEQHASDKDGHTRGFKLQLLAAMTNKLASLPQSTPDEISLLLAQIQPTAEK